MKKKAVLRTFFSLALVAILLCGCGSSKKETMTEGQSKVSEETTEITAKETTNSDCEEKEDISAKEDILANEEEVSTDEKTDETYKEMPVAQIETTVSSLNEFIDYAESLENPALLIYNSKEGYIVNMNDGEYYQIKAGDEIFVFTTDREVAMSDSLQSDDYINVTKDVETPSDVFKVNPNYSEYDSPHEVYYTVYYTDSFEDGDKYSITCYMDVPTNN